MPYFLTMLFHSLSSIETLAEPNSFRDNAFYFSPGCSIATILESLGKWKYTYLKLSPNYGEWLLIGSDSWLSLQVLEYNLLHNDQLMSNFRNL